MEELQNAPSQPRLFFARVLIWYSAISVVAFSAFWTWWEFSALPESPRWQPALAVVAHFAFFGLPLIGATLFALSVVEVGYLNWLYHPRKVTEKAIQCWGVAIGTICLGAMLFPVLALIVIRLAGGPLN